MKKYQSFLLGMIVAGAIFSLGATIGVKMYSVMSLTSADSSSAYPGQGNFLINAGVTISGMGAATANTAGLLQTITADKIAFSKSNGGIQMTLSALGITTSALSITHTGWSGGQCFSATSSCFNTDCTASCPTGMIVTGGGCRNSNSFAFWEFGSNLANTQWVCRPTTASGTTTAYVYCCPG